MQLFFCKKTKKCCSISWIGLNLSPRATPYCKSNIFPQAGDTGLRVEFF